MADTDDTVLALRTYTALWQTEKQLYKFYEWSLPFPISIRQIGVAILATAVWIGLLSLLRVPFTTDYGLQIVWIAPPLAAAYFAGKPLVEGKRLTELLVSQYNYVTQPYKWVRYQPWQQPQRVTTYAWTWQPHTPPATPTSE